MVNAYDVHRQSILFSLQEVNGAFTAKIDVSLVGAAYSMQVMDTSGVLMGAERTTAVQPPNPVGFFTREARPDGSLSSLTGICGSPSYSEGAENCEVSFTSTFFTVFLLFLFSLCLQYHTLFELMDGFVMMSSGSACATYINLPDFCVFWCSVACTIHSMLSNHLTCSNNCTCRTAGLPWAFQLSWWCSVMWRANESQ